MAKTVNYTPEQVSKMLEMYNELGNDGIEEIAAVLQKTVRSVRSKLVREGVYQAVPRTTVKKDGGPSKKQLLNELQEIVGFDVTGFSGATKPAIEQIIDRLRKVS